MRGGTTGFAWCLIDDLDERVRASTSTASAQDSEAVETRTAFFEYSSLAVANVYGQNCCDGFCEHFVATLNLVGTARVRGAG